MLRNKQVVGNTVLISNETFRKNIQHHPELKTADYGKIAEILDKGSVYSDRQKNALFVVKDNYALALKITSNNEVLITSFRKMSKEQLSKSLKNRKLIR